MSSLCCDRSILSSFLDYAQQKTENYLRILDHVIRETLETSVALKPLMGAGGW